LTELHSTPKALSVNALKRFARNALNVIDPDRHLLNLRDHYYRDFWLRRLTNIIDVGANAGQERQKYASSDLGVLWIEPIPSVFEELKANIARYPKQIARMALVTDQPGKSVQLNVASNGGQSSSIFELADHKEIWPEIGFTERIDIITESLDEILSSDSRKYDGLVMDAQGSELLILKGAIMALSGLKYIKTEAANFEMYKGGAYEHELVSYLKEHGFHLRSRNVFAKTPDRRGEVSDLLFERRKRV
jgi:FkbM family methyltransferase